MPRSGMPLPVRTLTFTLPVDVNPGDKLTFSVAHAHFRTAPNLEQSKALRESALADLDKATKMIIRRGQEKADEKKKEAATAAAKADLAKADTDVKQAEAALARPALPTIHNFSAEVAKVVDAEAEAAAEVELRRKYRETLRLGRDDSRMKQLLAQAPEEVFEEQLKLARDEAELLHAYREILRSMRQASRTSDLTAVPMPKEGGPMKKISVHVPVPINLPDPLGPWSTFPTSLVMSNITLNGQPVVLGGTSSSARSWAWCNFT